MNCFEWQSNLSDYLDGTLAEDLRKKAEEHLAQCQTCRERHDHFRIILTSIASQPRTGLPAGLRKSPLSTTLARESGVKFQRYLPWKQVPWYVRTTVEGTGIVLLILLAISTGPKLRVLYEKSIERSVDEFNETFTDVSNITEAAANLPLTRQNPQISSEDDFSDDNGEETVSEADEDDSESSEYLDSDDIQVGSSEIWRFNLKTDSPHEIRPKVVQILTDLNIPRSTPGLGGIEAPGGIQFDLFVSPGVIPGLKRQLQKIAPRMPAEQSTKSHVGETFAWYKNKSRRKLPPGKIRVVIWLSQM